MFSKMWNKKHNTKIVEHSIKYNFSSYIYFQTVFPLKVEISKSKNTNASIPFIRLIINSKKLKISSKNYVTLLCRFQHRQT